jgi:hypothetical protein
MCWQCEGAAHFRRNCPQKPGEEGKRDSGNKQELVETGNCLQCDMMFENQKLQNLGIIDML